MGSGKGALEYWVAVVKPGRVMFEIAGVSEEIAREALRLAMHKLPCKCKIVSRADLEGGSLQDLVGHGSLPRGFRGRANLLLPAADYFISHDIGRFAV